MSEAKQAVIIAVTGIATGIAGWLFGGKQKLKIDGNEVITRGANAIVETTNTLLATLQVMIEEEREHRKSCEDSLREHQDMLRKLDNEIKQLKRKI
jgi:hypothetical protein